MLRATLHFALGAAVFATSTWAAAMGFGRSTTQTSLGQPLDFAASIELDADEVVQRECVFADVYSGDARIAPADVRVVLEPAREAGQRSVRVTTSVRIDEPVVTIEVSVGCVSRLSRRFVTFIDPPLLRLAEASRDDSLPALAPRIAAQSQDLADIARSADASRRRAAGPGAAARQEAAAAHRQAGRAARSSRVAGSSTQAAAKPHGRVASRTSRQLARTALVASPGAGVPRLRLDPPVPAEVPRVAASAPGRAAPALPVDPATALAIAPASVGEAASDVLQRERDRIQVLEAGLVSLRSDTQATRQTVAALQARLREAEAERYANGLVYALAGVALLFALIAAALWWLRPRQRARARWFEAQARAARAAQRKDPTPGVTAAPPTEPPPAWTTRPANVLATAPAAIGGLEVTTVLGPEFSRPTSDPFRPSGFGALPKKTGELSIEELIDLEQQAEFFVVLGQDEAAISLLDSYMRGDGGKSPLPYLQLLEIHQRRSEQVAYERVRQAFNDRFNAHAPEWSSDLHFGRTLADYPQTIARLQSLWPTPLSAMQALDNLLFRRHSADDAFDFPAYRELLFLYSIARELSGHVETDLGSIDLFLPLEDAPPPKQAGAVSANDGGFAVDLDVSNWPEDATMSDLLIRRSPRQRGGA